MKNVLIVHPQFDVIGGAELVSARIMQWIANTFESDITLLTLIPVKLDFLVTAGMSEETARKIKFEIAGCPQFILNSSGGFHLLKLAFLHSGARKICFNYDICISTYNELDFGKKGIQYIHHPSFADRSLLRDLSILGKLSVLDSIPVANYLYRKLVSIISGEHINGYQRNVTLVNSHFMNHVLQKAYGITGEVVYPAFLSADWCQGAVGWEHREFRFVSIGRISPDKNLLSLIDYYALLYKDFPMADFVIIGRTSDPKYESLVVRSAETRGIPLRILKNLPDQELKALLNSSKFYIHPKVNEHFGIAIVEAAALGCLTMVHHSGAAEEIVKSPQLLFKDGPDLLSKVKCFNNDGAIGARAQSTLLANLAEFTLQRFYSRLDNIVLPVINKMTR